MKRVWIVAAILSVVTAVSAARPDFYQDLLKYKNGESQTALAEIETEMRTATVQEYPGIEAKLMAVLRSPEATADAKEFVCRKLRQIGSAKCVPVVAALLRDEKFSHMARWVLQGNSSVEAGAALREALTTTKGNLLVGVIGSVGARRDAVAVNMLEKLAKDADTAVAAAALMALGHIGDSASAKAIEAARPADGATLKVWAAASVECADRLAKSGEAVVSAKIFRGVYENPAMGSACRVGAFVGLAHGKQITATELMAALQGNDAKLQIAAAEMVGTQDEGTVKACLEALPTLPSNLQVILVTGFAANGNMAASGAIAALAEGAISEVSLAAIRALGVLNDESQVPLLVRLALGGDEKAAVAKESLTRFRGEKVREALLKLLKSGTVEERTKALEILMVRNDRGSTVQVLAACRDDEKKVRLAAYKALRTLANEKSLGTLADLLIATKSDGERSELEQTMVAAALRGQDVDAVATVLIEKLGKSAEADSNLLNVLAKRGGAKALKEVRKTLATGSDEQKKVAVRAMSVWADTTPLKDLLNIAQTSENPVFVALALRGYVRLVASAGGSSDEKVKMYKSALTVSTQASAIKQVLGGLGEVKDIGALKLAAEYLSNDEVVNEAAAAVLNNSRYLIEKKKKSNDKVIIEALRKITASQAAEGLRKQAEELLTKLSNPVKKK